MPERFTNFGESTLNGAINNAVTSLVVTSAATFPTAGQFRIRLDDEIMLVTAVSGTTFTVARAQEGTAAASHSDAVAVRHVLTAAALLAFIGTPVVKLADESLSANSTLQADDELTFVTEAGFYEVEFSIYYTGTGTAGDFKWQFVTTNVAANTMMGFGSHASTAGTRQSFVGGASSNFPASAGASATDNGPWALMGRFVFLATSAGTVTFQWAQNTSNGETLTVKAGSTLRYRKLG